MLSKYIFGSGSSKAKTITHNLIGRSTLAKCYLHATSEAEYDECRELIPGWEGFVLPNIIALPDIAIVPQQNEVFTLIFLSRVHPKKGLEVLFEAMSKLRFKILLRIAGTGDEEYIAQLKQLSVTLKVDDQIEWLGWRNRDEKFVEMMKADLFVLPSLNENFANVVIESLHVGTAVLVTEQVGLANFVKAKNTGWVSRLDAADLAEKITEARQDTAKLNHIRAHGRNIIEENFSEKVLIRQYIHEYQKINASVA